jgi:iron(III) transport system substrate-binding protein
MWFSVGRSDRSSQLIVRLAAGLGSLVLLAGCTTTQAPVAPREQQAVVAQPDEQLTPEQRKYRDALKEFQDTVVPAAKKEGELNWYACQQANETEKWIQHFNKYYPEITVNHVYGPGPTLVEKIATEVAAGQVTADSYICGVTSARNLTARPNVAFAPNPPSALNPDVKWNWPPLEGNGMRVLWATNGIAGLTVNTDLVTKDHYPKTWWDLLKDPYWLDLFKRNLVGMSDPRASGFGHQVMYGLRVLNKAEYGEPFVRELAALKPIKFITSTSEVQKGERFANIGSAVTSVDYFNKDPIALVCPAPGCVQSFLAPATIKGPHPNAARLWAEFWLTKEGQEFLRDIAYTIDRTDVPVPPELDWKNFQQLYFASDDHDAPAADALVWNRESKLWDY